MTDHWFPATRRTGSPTTRLFCFPYAGGSAGAFVRWSDGLPSHVEVRPLQLPGRGNRLSETPIASFDDAINGIVTALTPLLDRPFAVFGHSMGALLAFEVTRRLRRDGKPAPLHLFVSGRRAPHLHADWPPTDSDTEVEALLRDLQGTPSEVFENIDLMRLLLPAIRADFAICRSYRYEAEPPLECPLTVFGGTEDIESEDGRLQAWRMQTAGPCVTRIFSGGHFFLQSAAQSLLSLVGAALLKPEVDCEAMPGR
jgi:medium-chain acyl-[acyl-carrier-protein] hydrolase